MRQLELALERARHGREQVHVDERAGEREEDLLHQHPAEDAREVRAGDDRDEHQQHHERADVGRQKAVERDAGRVGREHLAVRGRRVRIAGAQDEVPAERGERGLQRLQRPAGHEVAEPDARQGVPEARNQPATSMPNSPSTATSSAIPASHASTLTSRRPRDGSPNGSQRR